MIYIAILISSIYILSIITFIIGFDMVKIVKNKNYSPKKSFSIVIPFRNEAINLPVLLDSLSSLNYPTYLFEILFINDDSTDNFKIIIENFQKQNPLINSHIINNCRKTKSPKKDAILTAVEHSKFDWIVTTDADCEAPINWLNIFNQFIEDYEPLLISAPVKFKPQNSILHHFQNLNFLSLIGSTIGGFGLKQPFMCNGANLCYDKKTFIEINGFSGNENIASGDDIFLLQKINEIYPNKVTFLKSEQSIITTKSENNWKLFINQQIRWASKSTAYKGKFAKFIGITVYLENLIMVCLGLLTLLNLFYWKIFIFFLILKIIVDYILISKTSNFLKIKKTNIYYLIISLFYPFHTTIIGCSSLFKKYEWKDRRFNK